MQAFLNQLPQQLVNGLTLGAVYALIALGYSMVYGILQLLNFAHGDVYMVGAYVGYGVLAALAPKAGLLAPAWLIIVAMLLAAMLTCGLLGVVIEWFAYRPLRNAPRIAPLISALGVSFFIQNAVLLTLSANYRTMRTEVLLPPRLGIDIEQQSLGLALGEVRHGQSSHRARCLRDGSATQRRTGADHQLRHLTPAVGLPLDPERAQRLPGQGRQSQQWRSQSRGAQGEDVVNCLAEARDEVLIEHPHDDAHVGIEAADHQRRGDVDEIVAGEDEHAAGAGYARLFEHVPASAVAADE